MKIALAHDFLAFLGGAEKVLSRIHEIWPSSPIYVLFYNKEKVKELFDDKKINIKTSLLQNIPFSKRFYRLLMPLMPNFIERFNLSNYDIVISSSTAYAKGVLTRPETLHICYCHTPTRYLWQDTHDYVRNLPYPDIIKKVIPFGLTYLRLWDGLASGRVDKFIANSRAVQDRIRKYYRKEADVIYPPVDTKSFKISQDTEDYFLLVGRMRHHKRVDLAIRAFNKLKLPLKVIGDGPDLSKFRKMANKNIEFLGWLPQNKLKEYYSKCLALLHPQEEDFGIVPLEAMASGRPVIAYSKGGALETVVENVTGNFFHEQTPSALTQAVRDFHPENFDPQVLRNRAAKFDVEVFKRRMKEYVEKAWREFNEHK